MNSMAEITGTALVAHNIVIMLGFGLWYRYACRPNSPLTRKKTKEKKGPMVVWSILIAITMCTVSTQLVNIIGFFTPDVVNEFADMLVEALSSPLTILAVVLLAPIAEELVFRGVVQHYMMKVSSRFWIANASQALMFAIMHMNLIQGLYTFLLGLVLGWLRYRYKSLAAPIIMHFVNNFSTVTWLGWLLGLVPDTLSNYFIILSLAVSATAGILVLIGQKKETAV
jgi:membrane protease YdiL (CAAX protease family)